jgi:hypothetical protein
MTRYKVGDIILRKSEMFIIVHKNDNICACDLCCFNTDEVCGNSRRSALVDSSDCIELIDVRNGDYFINITGGL